MVYVACIRIVLSMSAVKKQQFIQLYLSIRQKTEALCKPLAIEDYVIQSMDDASPPKWHLAHTTWFFENFLLQTKLRGYEPFNHAFHYLFNSYYQHMGSPFPKVRRGLLSRPTVETIYAYRAHVDKFILELIEQQDSAGLNALEPLLTLALNHEQQHQELLLMDIKHNFFIHPDFPIYSPKSFEKTSAKLHDKFVIVKGGVIDMGHHGDGFSFDNETPLHKQFLNPYSISSRLVTNAEYCEFINAGGYKKSDFWSTDGWAHVQRNRWDAPLYWQEVDDAWNIFTLSGLQELNPSEPVSHVSYYEADAYARWKGQRLPTEVEWEHYVTSSQFVLSNGNFMESDLLHPRALSDKNKDNQQFFGDVWEWTSSSYSPYPGYQASANPVGEYSGKFMNNQMVMRGGSCVTPESHIRASYRNFFSPEKRWQFSGIRLANAL